MKLSEIIQRLGLAVCTHPERGDTEVTGGYSGDLLSDVIANAQAGQVWVTIQTHSNVVAVAALKDLAAVVLANGRTPQDDTLRKAEEQNVILLTSGMTSFELAGKIYEMIKEK
ncbi:MAG: serine kinase [Candidatus Sumerlaeia bacterium]|nr:serine kinase [Candidatus Sumerlaeia bacterium]